MNCVLPEKILSDIYQGKNLDKIIKLLLSELLISGPSNPQTLELISCIKFFQPNVFAKYEQEFLLLMGLFFKDCTPNSIQSLLFETVKDSIVDTYRTKLTPSQADIYDCLKNVQYFSFSAPTSTGKSHIFRNLIAQSTKDVVIIVPSRALINEYFSQISQLLNRSEINILTFVERVNLKHASRNVFILTPERARELFRNKNWIDLEFILFDEAQLSDEESRRGLFFDSIVRRSVQSFPDAKIIFAQPFIENPEAQIAKITPFIKDFSRKSNNYHQRNVGQLYYEYVQKKDRFNLICTSNDEKITNLEDPVERVLKNNGSVLIYVPKTSILTNSIQVKFKKYISLCKLIKDKRASKLIKELRDYLGASSRHNAKYHSRLLDNLRRGIVTHHGSLPLVARKILEEYTQLGFCRICFATSTLEQGINMPFDLVYLDRFEKSKPLSIKNLIGRAGRSSLNNTFDFGAIVVKQQNVKAFKTVLSSSITLNEHSWLDPTHPKADQLQPNDVVFRDAINSGLFSDEYNLTDQELIEIQSDNVHLIISDLLDLLFIDSRFQPNFEKREQIYRDFQKLYAIHLHRELAIGEKGVFSTAIKIFIWAVIGKTFSQICKYRFDYISGNVDQKLNNDTQKPQTALFSNKYIDIPNTSLKQSVPLFDKDTPIQEVDYDQIVYDTYDYLDKIIGFRFGDLFYAMFWKYFERTKDSRAKTLALLFKYKTDYTVEIWLLKYGFSFEEIEWVLPCVDNIDENEIVFNSKVNDLTPAQAQTISHLIYNK